MGITVIRSVRLFDGVDVHESSTVIFDSSTGKITSVSDSNAGVKGLDPSEVQVIDGTGHTLLPGLIDAHVHVHDLHLPKGEDHDEVLRSPLRCGVTTICDMHSDPAIIHKLRAQVKEEEENAQAGNGTITRADLKSSLYGATIAGGWPKPVVLGHNPSEELHAIVATWPSVTPETAADFIKSHKAGGADYIKLMQENCCSLALPTNSIPVATLELQKAVVDAAHAEGLLVVGHATALESTEIVLKAGGDGLTHTFIDQSPTDAIIPLYKQNNAFVIPTLVILSSLTNELQDLRESFAEVAYGNLGVVDGFTKQNMVEFLGMKAQGCTIEYAYETLKLFRKHGIDIVAGTDSACGLKGTGIGPSLWMELQLYIDKCGMSVVEALRSATSVTADRFKFNDRGRVEAGKRADLVLVKGDPTERLADFWEKGGVAGVWKLGHKAH